MKKQKFLIVDNSSAVNKYLDDGWIVISVTPQMVSATANRGYFAIVIEKQ
jgi:hypothetical protein